MKFSPPAVGECKILLRFLNAYIAVELGCGVVITVHWYAFGPPTGYIAMIILWT